MTLSSTQPHPSRPASGPSARRARLAVAGLLMLSLVPVLAGALRVGEVVAGDVGPDDARFLAAPVPVLLHIAAATVYSVLGALQFAPGLRRRHNAWHRGAGMILVPAGFVVAGSGLWMTATYDMPAHNDAGLAAVRTVVGVAMIAQLALAVRALVRHDHRAHGAWMTRAYALALGAGTQVVTLFPMIVTGTTTAWVNTLLMTLGWAVNASVAEWVIVRRRRS
ncbi:putative membrane protein [Isoptericola sp. CG 20/1183]|uniref:Membrane protein n=1 Tax=Isoptericola halotolerans TaxID=300560 RepID=A0ABX5EEI6_9MICO|nr:MULTISPECIES: DUF2306 domain-containing protein [Isoptericola]PRZ05530.1 putative membrane protein [Isoptericola halotolerans]PRZ06098.1 putative membrane protein [Isoptericola sp. CG 20/1183]